MCVHVYVYVCKVVSQACVARVMVTGAEARGVEAKRRLNMHTGYGEPQGQMRVRPQKH